ncbi:dihydroorotate dehydrogenase [Daldinia eschscholtzii]|nr:dihydroorotate dehydrogenase [Daldinia eschscholtzii]
MTGAKPVLMETKKVPPPPQPPPRLRISPPLVNSANPWATTREDLRALFECACTGGVTTRTATLGGFAHDARRHRYAFFDAGTQAVVADSGSGSGSGSGSDSGEGEGKGMREGEKEKEKEGEKGIASLNNMGYSPVPLDEYLAWIEEIVLEQGEGEKEGERGKGKKKVFIVSVTGSPDEVAECYRRIAGLAAKIDSSTSSVVSDEKEEEEEEEGGGYASLAMEINLSCPNIPSAPPPAYSAAGLETYLEAVALLAADREELKAKGGNAVPWGVKIPPYTHAGQFEMLVDALKGLARTSGGCCPVGFVTATNTLGSCLLLDGSEGNMPVLGSQGGSGIGGMAGAPLHPLALGNVATLRRMLDASPGTADVQIIGVGGVSDSAGYRRMRDVGAAAVAVGTALGRKGVGVFGEIEDGLRELAGDGKDVKW